MDLIKIGFATVAIVDAVKTLFPSQVQGVVTIVVAAVVGAVLFNLDFSNPIISGAVFGLDAAGFFKSANTVGTIVGSLKK